MKNASLNEVIFEDAVTSELFGAFADNVKADCPESQREEWTGDKKG